MLTVNMHDAKSKLSSLVESLETGYESEVIIARNGTPVARLVAFSAPNRIGAARHLLAGLGIPSSIEVFNAGDAGIAAEFETSAQQALLP